MAVAGVATLLLAADEVSRDDLKARRARIEKMSPLEREVLHKKFDRFTALSPEQQQSCRDIHRAVEEDHSGRELRNVVSNYSAWLRTLSPWQRQKIRDEADPQKRLALVREIKADQELATERRAPDDRTGGRRSDQEPSRPGRWNRFWRLGTDDLQRVVDVVEESVPFSQEERDQFAKLERPAHRHVHIMLAAIQRAFGDDVEAARRSWPNDALMNEMADAIHDERYRNLPRDEEHGDDHRRRLLRLLLFNSLKKEAEGELDVLIPNRRETILAYVKQLDENERFELLNQGLEGSRGHDDMLAWRYLQAQHNPYARDLEQLGKVLRPWFPRRFDGQRELGPDRKGRPRPGEMNDDRKPREGLRKFRERPREPQERRPEGPPPPRKDKAPPK
jgi:hypothetical protein